MKRKIRKELLPICAMLTFIASFIGAAQAQTYYYYNSLPGLVSNADDCYPFCATNSDQDLDINISSIDFLTILLTEDSALIDIDVTSSTITDFSALALEVIVNSGQSIIDTPIKSGNNDMWSLDISRDLAYPSGETDITLKFSMNGQSRTKDISVSVYACDPADPLASFVKSGSYHIIGSTDQLLCLSNNQTAEVLSADYRLGDYIDFGSYDSVDWDGNGSADGSGTSGWMPLGSYVDIDNNSPYTGTFDGDNYDITDLYINRTGADRQGLISYAEGATVKDLNLIDANLYARSYVGGIFGEARDSTVSNLFISGSIRGTSADVGAISGGLRNVTVSYCGSSATIQGAAHYIGGLAGVIYENSLITHSYSTGNVTCTNWQAGGIVGAIGSGSTVSQSYYNGTVTANSFHAGGIAGALGNGSIINSYAKGVVTGDKWNGGIAGIITYVDSAISNSYSSSVVSGIESYALAGKTEPVFDPMVKLTTSYAVNSTRTALPSPHTSHYTRFCSDDFDGVCYGTVYKLSHVKEFWDDDIWRNLEDAEPEFEWQYPADTYDSIIIVGGPI